MSHVVYFCDSAVCVFEHWGKHYCAGCNHLEFSEQVADVYRPHRRMVTQSCWHLSWMANRDHFPRVLLQARLGCPAARAWVKRKRRIENGTFLTRMHWARKARTLDHGQSIIAYRTFLNDKVPF